jgi:GTP cyclohydrolase I
MDREKAIKAIEDLLDALGEDRQREGLKETPRRVADAFAEFISGNDLSAQEILSKTFSVKGGDMVIEKDIAFSSTCEHHLMPFFGKIAIAYIPNEKVVGLSKLARLVNVFAKRLQLQEQLTGQIAQAIMDFLQPKGVMVWCEAEHTCMTCRGVGKYGSKTITYVTLGEFSEDKKREVLCSVK